MGELLVKKDATYWGVSLEDLRRRNLTATKFLGFLQELINPHRAQTWGALDDWARQVLIDFRQKHPVFTRRRFFEGEPIFRGGLSDIGWFRPEQRDGRRRGSQGPPSRSPSSSNSACRYRYLFRGRRVVDDSVLLLLNGRGDRRSS